MKTIIYYILLFFHFGSFAQKSIPNSTELCKLLTEMSTKDQLYRKGEIIDTFSRSESKYSKREIDSVWTLQREIDNTNAEKLIELTKKQGWLSDEKIKCPNLNIWIIFRHSQKQYFEEISELIEKEHNANRLNDFHYKMINDHLNGRPRG